MNGYYSAQIIVCDPKEADPAVLAFMQAVATAAGLEVEFSQIDGNYYFSEEYPELITGTIKEYVEGVVAALEVACPDAEYTTSIEEDEYGDYHLTIVFGVYTIELSIEDWTSYLGYYDIYVDVAVAED